MCRLYFKHKIECALVSTNSITQGEQVAVLWKNLIENGLIINFAHRTFRWDSESNSKAHVHCVIIGFSYFNRKEKLIYDNGKRIVAKNVSPYLIDAPNAYVISRSKPLCKVSKMDFGSMPNDKGFLSNYSVEEKEFINNKTRYCIWLKDVSPTIYKKIPPIMEAIKNVKELRENSTREATRKLAETPYLFGEIRQPNTDYLVIPRVSSENRKYIPIGYLISNIIASDANLMIPNATLYHFGILTSNVHNAWMRAVCGRLKSDYRYSAKIVYNNFPRCNPSDEQRVQAEKTAQAILDARALYPNSSLADLYDELTMPKELRKAHQDNDRAVMKAYGFPVSRDFTESMCVAELMKMYKNLTE